MNLPWRQQAAEQLQSLHVGKAVWAVHSAIALPKTGCSRDTPSAPWSSHQGGTAPEPLNGCLYTLVPFSNIQRPSVYSIALKEHLAIKSYPFFLMVRGPWGPPQATYWAQVTNLPSEDVCKLAGCL